MNVFRQDPFPGKPRILFIGFPNSTHTHAWIDLLEEAALNVRLFSVPGSTPPPDSWRVPTYVTGFTTLHFDRAWRRRLYPPDFVSQTCSKILRRLVGTALERRWLSHVIREWQPTIIHTLGLDPAGYFYLQVCQEHDLSHIGRWVLQLRGGSDLALPRYDPDLLPGVAEVLSTCDQIITDNLQNIRYIEEIGISVDKIAPLVPVPGTGGVDVTGLSKAVMALPPAQRRVILWPKAYNCPWSIALPVLEAIQLCWDRIQPCEIHILGVDSTTRMWLWALPESIRQYCHISDRVPREEVLDLVGKARVVLAPSLVDGVPNILYEAMASGAFPIVSPLETIIPVVESESNVLFARNLYPDEIASALVRVMTDNVLVTSAAQRNLELVSDIADRKSIAPKVIGYYEALAANAHLPTG
ncbi:MAG: glycosyltransferase family 4 protein [Anaerolineales bacterium]|nr:glycosyltransferase family 4 protein [Anaerolineales bacterium]